MLVNLEHIDDEIFIDIFLSRKELSQLTETELLTSEKTIGKNIVHVGICSPTIRDSIEGNYYEDEEENDQGKEKD